jgi:hypothetical protein
MLFSSLPGVSMRTGSGVWKEFSLQILPLEAFSTELSVMIICKQAYHTFGNLNISLEEDDFFQAEK